jgi:N-glycosylase/DNA lyase
VQRYWVGIGCSAREVILPAPDSEVIRGIAWGRADTLDTAAYWALRCCIEDDPLHGFTSENGILIDEIGFCILGGFGITAELNQAAFKRLKSAGVFDLSVSTTEAQIKDLLLEPLDVHGRRQRYRFPNQRAKRLSVMRGRFADFRLEGAPVASVHAALRDVPGIGPKTAAWIIRNHFGSDDVAILDVHVLRACSRLRLFPEKVVLPRDYDHLQNRFLEFADALRVRACVLDAVMWSDMRTEPRSRRRFAA